MELTEEKSQQLANTINAIRVQLLANPIDVAYARAALVAMRNKASRMDAAAPLIRSYSPTKSDLLQKQADALGWLLLYIEALQQCDELKQRVQMEKDMHDQIENIFI